MTGKMTTLECANMLGLAPIEKTNPLAYQPPARTDFVRDDLEAHLHGLSAEHLMAFAALPHEAKLRIALAARKDGRKRA